jgi:hypothetical protein
MVIGACAHVVSHAPRHDQKVTVISLSLSLSLSLPPSPSPSLSLRPQRIRIRLVKIASCEVATKWVDEMVVICTEAWGVRGCECVDVTM